MNDFHPLTVSWFKKRFSEATPVQLKAWSQIRKGGDVLISAPTGSGKTFAAFLSCLDRLVTRGCHDRLTDQTSVVYVSPLKALSNDIYHNLEVPLTELSELAAAEGIDLPAVRVATRTGDTSAWEREKMVRRPPHVLVTTPESLFILVTAERSRRRLSAVETIIVDEIHALVDDKRGSHLALTLARLDDLVTRNGSEKPQRIGLSATVNPIDEVARFLSGSMRTSIGTGQIERPSTAIVNAGHRRPLDVAIEVPKEELGAIAINEMWDELYDRICELVLAHRTTIVFVNSRRLSERVAHHLSERLGSDAVLSHHGSLSRRLRQSAERQLKQGKLRAVVATASLELGIDVGSVDLVCQIGTPRSIAVALQRIGRSGHKVDPSFVPKGRIFPLTRDELVECAALVRAIKRGSIDERRFRPWPRDVLSQQIVAAVAVEPWSEDALFELVRSAEPYRMLPREEFDAVVAMLSDGIATSRGRNGTWLHRDGVNGVIRGRRGARLAAITSGGAIPDNANYRVVAEPEEVMVGTVDEDFAVESMAGDVFLLGTMSWRVRRVESGKVRVEDAHGAAPSVPFWLGEAPGRTRELSDEVSFIRERVVVQESGEQSRDDSIEFLLSNCGLNRSGAEQLVAYVNKGTEALGATPSGKMLIAERFFDESGGMQLVLHAPLGVRINRAWGLALRKRFCRSFNVELQAAATDNGLVISLTEQHSFPLEVVFKFLSLDTVEEVLTQAMFPAPMFGVRWRWNASRALAVLRFAGGRKVPPPILRMRSDDLLAAVFPDQVACQENLSGDIRVPNHPLVNETVRDCLNEAMDINGLKAVIAGIEDGTILTRAIDTAEPSPLSHEILNANPYAFLDDAPLEERRARAVQLRRSLPIEDRGLGSLDEDSVRAVAEEVWPVVRDKEELHDALLTLILMPPNREWTAWFDQLFQDARAIRFFVSGKIFWLATERIRIAQQVHPHGVTEPSVVPDVEQPIPNGEESAVAEVLRGWIESSGPIKASAIASLLSVELERIGIGLARLETEGQVLRGRYTSTLLSSDDDIEWCSRRVLARIHHLTLGRLRREIEPVSPAVLVRFLVRWQHLAAGTLLHGTSGLLQIIKQLQGYEIPAASWEHDVLGARVADYEPGMLDHLCLSGEVMWGRLSLHPTAEWLRSGTEPTQINRPFRRIRPTRAAPVTLFLRKDLHWLIPRINGVVVPEEGVVGGLSHPAKEILDTLHRRGASFISELIHDTARLATEVEDGIWELVAVGLVTADGFDNLRALIDPKRRRGEGKSRTARPRHSAGRWAMLVDRRKLDQPGRDPRYCQEQAEMFTRQLLQRWGVVFRDLVQRETLMPPWREILGALRRMEARGEVRGGRFVSGFAGEQFARADAVELLRIVRRENQHVDGVSVSAADPMNLLGIVMPGSRINSRSSETVELLNSESVM